MKDPLPIERLIRIRDAARGVAQTIEKWRAGDTLARPGLDRVSMAIQALCMELAEPVSPVYHNPVDDPLTGENFLDAERAVALLHNVVFDLGPVHKNRPPDDLSRTVEELALVNRLLGFLDSPSPSEAEPMRRRRKKQDVKLGVFGAVLYKIDHPEASVEDCAKAGDLPRTTLSGHSDWKEWEPRILEATETGKLKELKTAFDARIGQHVAVGSTDVNAMT
jgi:hypothetical protein